MNLKLPAHDTRVHVFAVSDGVSGPAQTTFLSRMKYEGENLTLSEMFEHDDLDIEGAEVFAVADIESMGLRGYLAEAYDIPVAALSADHAKLDGIGGDVVILTPKAVGRLEVTLTLDPLLTHIGSYAPAQPDNAPRPTPKVDLTPAPVALSPRPVRGSPWGLAVLILFVLIAIWAIL